tara:strand:+ start:227 stop:397 length:171 start_codon:yes stop_codon:yes gene_type:complete
MSSNVLLNILNFKENKESYSLEERKKIVKSYRIDLGKTFTKAGNVLESVIDSLNNA